MDATRNSCIASVSRKISVDRAFSLRFEYRNGHLSQYWLLDGRAYWYADAERWPAGEWKRHRLQSTTRSHLLGYWQQAMETEAPIRIVAILHGRTRVLRDTWHKADQIIM